MKFKCILIDSDIYHLVEISAIADSHKAKYMPLYVAHEEKIYRLHKIDPDKDRAYFKVDPKKIFKVIDEKPPA